MTLPWKRAIGRPAPVPGKTCRPLKPNIANLRSNYDRRLHSSAWGTWVNHVIQLRSCITLEDNTSSQSLLKKLFVLPNSTPETHRRRKHWLETMLSSIKSLVRISIWTFALIRPSKIIFFGFSLRFRSIRLSASRTIPVLHAQAWYQLSWYQATADLCVTSRGPGVFHLLGVSRFTDTGAVFGFSGR